MIKQTQLILKEYYYQKIINILIIYMMEQKLNIQNYSMFYKNNQHNDVIYNK